MMPDIFSSFDPFSFNSFFPSNSLFLITNMVLITLIQSSFWLITSRNTYIKFPMSETIFAQLSRTNSVSLKGLSSLISTLFITIIMINLLGLFPYSFSTSSHLVFTLMFGLPLWMSMIISSFVLSPKKSIAHLLPDGAPDWLNPFLVLIETTSILVRPLTLSFRLAANMSAGHIVLGLVGIYAASAWFLSAKSIIIMSVFTMGYILFEVAICLIQAYIFCLLLSLYSDDHSH